MKPLHRRLGLALCMLPAACGLARPALRVNQAGYLPGARKVAVLVTESSQPEPWQLIDAEGQVLEEGQSVPFGRDAASEDQVHRIDFSSFRQPATGLVLSAGDEQSHPFDVREDLFHELKYQALAYFYHNRSGIPILMPFAGHPDYTRPAGHLSDAEVPCWRARDCTYKLDVSGGWYDAGDHGKYVVNGGISVWTLLNQYERAKYLGSSLADFGDKTLQIPEAGNGASDLLDEVRWEMDFLMKMQVPDGQQHAGMAHHKMHDHAWTALGFRAPSHADNRALHPVSTAATLNLAATAAQCARIWRTIEPAFSRRCLASAGRAWNAALKFPELYAPERDKNGGGPYDDDHVEDEFFWAAAELYITLGDEAFLRYLKKSPYFDKFPMHVDEEEQGASSSLNWQRVAAAGTISLAVVPSQLPQAVLARFRGQITRAADEYLKIADSEGYRVPLRSDHDGKYPWGSNSFVINNLIVMGLAHDFTKDKKYVYGMLDGMDYLMGRNALDQSYISGYGERPVENVHHRFWAHQEKARYPIAPPGVLSGGPNSGLEDPQTRKLGLRGCPAQKCFIDHIQAWSVNEVTINWNAPLAWVAAYLDEKSASL